MGVLRVGGGISGIIEYLLHGKKQGQKLTRDELDERIILHGDIDVTRSVIESMNFAGQKYLHITFSVKERDLSVETYKEIDSFIREKLLAAYASDEINYYSELQLPRIKNILNKATGEYHERLGHFHVVMPEVNLITGKKENPIGVFKSNVEYFEAIQELANIKFGLASPKDNARVDISHADIIGRNKEVDTFKKGAFKDLRSQLANDILEKEINSYESFQEHLKGIGTVKITNAGKDNEYLGVKPFGKGNFINLREAVFRRDFFELPEADRAQALGAADREAPSSRLRPKRTEEQYEKSLRDWVEWRSKEVRYLNSGSKTYKKYFAADATKEEKAEILAYYEQRAQTNRLKKEQEHDDKYREQGRPTERGRAAMAKDAARAGEGIFAERAEQQALARILGNDHQSGLAIGSTREAPRLGDRVRSLSQGDVAGERRHAAGMVQGDAHNDVGTEARRSAGDGVQWAAGSDGRINPATGRTSDTVTAQLLRDIQEAARQEAGDKKPTIKEIKSHLDAQRLLGDLAKSHLLRPEDYEISAGAGEDSGARIRHRGGHHGDSKGANVRYNVSDFLTKHMRMSWSEAEPYLAQCYDRQKNKIAVEKVPSKARRDLYAQFQADRRAEVISDPGQAKRDQERQRESELARRSEINDRFIKAKASIKADPDLSAAQRKAQRSIAQMTKVEEQRLLGLEIQRERAELKRANSTTEQYRLWLQVKAQTGDPDALIELREQGTGPARHTATLERIIAAVNDKPDAGKLLEQAEREKQDRLRYTVERNGDVTYSRDGRELLLDTGRKVYMIEQSNEAIEQGLRLAAQKWGGKMQLTGSDEFIKQAITIAADKKMRIQFADPEHNTMLKAAIDKAHLDYMAQKNKESQKRDEAARAELKATLEARIAAKSDVKAPAPDQPAQPAPATPEPAKPVTPEPVTPEQPAPAPGQQVQHQVVYAPPLEQDDDLDREQEIIKPPGS